ncbi:hypothetical protein FRX31_002512, partial [Thalictrum thalictroides]
EMGEEMEVIRMFRIHYDGTWEEGEEPVLFPDRKLVYTRGKSEWVDDGRNFYPSYKYIKAKTIETLTKWDGDTANIIDIKNWIKENLPGCADPIVVVDLYWLWGQRRFHIKQDGDILYFWAHAAQDERGYTDLIIHTNHVVPLQMVRPDGTPTTSQYNINDCS